VWGWGEEDGVGIGKGRRSCLESFGEDGMTEIRGFGESSGMHLD
jgi:hypothetical protein